VLLLHARLTIDQNLCVAVPGVIGRWAHGHHLPHGRAGGAGGVLGGRLPRGALVLCSGGDIY